MDIAPKSQSEFDTNVLASFAWRAYKQKLCSEADFLQWLLVEGGKPIEHAMNISKSLGPADIINIRNAADLQKFESLLSYTHNTPTTRLRSHIDFPPPQSHSDVEKSVTSFCNELAPSLKKFIVNGKHSVPKWSPLGTGAFYEHIRALNIPQLDGRMNLLLHDLGEFTTPDVENVSKLFTGKKAKLLCNVSGSGKTRTLLQGLHRTWGLYFVCDVDSHDIGSRDIQSAMDHLASLGTWVEPLPEDCRHAVPASERNNTMARDQFEIVILARLIILNLFLEICTAHHGITEEHKGFWALLQVSPNIFNNFHLDIFSSMYKLLSGTTYPYAAVRMRAELGRFRSHVPTGGPLVCILDEAHVAARMHRGAFISEFNPAACLPILRSIIGAVTMNFALIVSGTDISMDEICPPAYHAVAEDNVFRTFHETGSLDDANRHAMYMRKYLPAEFLQDEVGKQLLKRAWHWLHGRYRFTSAFITLLLSNGGRSPHRLLDAFVEHLTGYCPNDGTDLRQNEPAEIPPIDVKRICNVQELQHHESPPAYFHGLRWLVPVLRTDANLITNASMIVFRHMTGRGPRITPQEHPRELVELGFARFLDRAGRVDITENLALLCLAQWLEHQPGFTLKDFLNDPLGHPNVQAGGHLFEDVVTFYLYTAFQDFTELTQAFEFVPPAPDWASQRARLVTFTLSENGEYQWAQVHSLAPVDPGLMARAPMAVDSGTEDQDAVISWLEDQRYVPIFLPTTITGPDHLMLLELEDGRHVWVPTQAKCLKDVLVGRALTSAIETVTPPFFSRHAEGEKKHQLAEGVDRAMRKLPNPVPGRRPVLRVIASMSGVRIDDYSAGEVPLAILKMEPFENATCNGAVRALTNALLRRK